jgi:hypothetical protein
MVSSIFLRLRRGIPGLLAVGSVLAVDEPSVAIVLGAVRSALWLH